MRHVAERAVPESVDVRHGCTIAEAATVRVPLSGDAGTREDGPVDDRLYASVQ
jgi:hypothetical protein